MSRPRPTAELVERLRAGKRALHAEQRELSLPEKLQQLLALQKIDYEIRTARGDELLGAAVGHRALIPHFTRYPNLRSSSPTRAA